MARFWKDVSARAFSEMDMEKCVAVLPVGAIEQHGPHLPVSVDAAIIDGIVAATASELPPDSHVLFLPTMPYGKSDEHSLYAGTLTVSAETLMNLWTETGASVARAGVRKFVILNSHGGQIAVMDIVARRLRIEQNLLTFAVNWFQLVCLMVSMTIMSLRMGSMPATWRRRS